MPTENETLAKALADVAIGQQALIQALADPPKDPEWQRVRAGLMEHAATTLQHVLPVLIDQLINRPVVTDIPKPRSVDIDVDERRLLRECLESLTPDERSAIRSTLTEMQQQILSRAATGASEIGILYEFDVKGLFEISQEQMLKLYNSIPMEKLSILFIPYLTELMKTSSK